MCMDIGTLVFSIHFMFILVCLLVLKKMEKQLYFQESLAVRDLIMLQGQPGRCTRLRFECRSGMEVKHPCLLLFYRQAW